MKCQKSLLFPWAVCVCGGGVQMTSAIGWYFVMTNGLCSTEVLISTHHRTVQRFTGKMFYFETSKHPSYLVC